MTFFYDLNKKLASIADKPVTKQLNEGAVAEASTGDYSAKKARAGKDIGKPGKNFEKIAKSAGEKYGSKERGEKVAGAVLAKLRGKNESVEEGLGNVVQKIGKGMKKAAGAALNTLGHGSDEDLIKDLQKKVGMPQTGKKPMAVPRTPITKEEYGPLEEKEGGVPMTAKQKKFAKLAPPADKITFADKIAGAKKEVDEMLGDVAAEAMRNAVGKKKVVADEGWDDMMKDVERRRSKPAVGSVERGHKHDIEHTATGRKVTRRVDDQGHSVGADDETDTEAPKRGRGRPKGTGKSMGAKGPSGKSKLMTKENTGMKHTFAILDDTLIDQIAGMNGAEVDPDAGSVETWDENTARQLIAFAQKNPKRLKRTQSMNTAGMKPMAQRVSGTATGPEYNLKEEGDDVKAAMKLLKKAGYKVSKDGAEELDEKAVSKKQQKFMGMVHAAQKGEKPASKEVAKVAKTMKKKDAEDFASTKHKGLPEKVKSKKKEESVEETADTPKASTSGGGMTFGKGIYDSMNRELEKMISEAMNISTNMSTDEQGQPHSSVTVTATDEDAGKLSELLKMAGVGGGHEEACPTCGSTDCGCGDVHQEVDENAPDWPTNAETNNDALQYAGGLNKPKTTVAGDGQTTVPVTAVQVREDAGLAGKEALAKRIYDLGMLIHRSDRMYAQEEPEAQAELAKLKAQFAQQFPGEDAFKLGSAINDREYQAQQAQRSAEIKQNQQAATRTAGVMQKAKNALSGMFEQEQVMAPESDELKRIREMAGIKTEAKKVEEDDVEEGNKFTGELAKARAAGKKEADLDGDGDMEKVRESVNKMANLWKAYKG